MNNASTIKANFTKVASRNSLIQLQTEQTNKRIQNLIEEFKEKP